MDSVRKNEIIAVILFAASLFFFISIFTFTAQDMVFYTSSPNPAFHNLTGLAGAYIGGILLFLTGKAAYVIPALAFVWGISRLFQLEPRKIFFKIFGTVFLITAVSASLSVLNYPDRTLSFVSGGVIGTVVSEFLIRYLGSVGTMVFISATIILSVMVATEFLILPVIMAIFRFAKKAPSAVMSFVSKKMKKGSGAAAPGRNRLREAKEEISRKLEAMKRQVEESRRASRDEKMSRKNAAIAISTGPKWPGPRSARPVKVVSPQAGSPVKSASPGVSASQASGTRPLRVGVETVEYKLPTLDLLKSSPKGREREREEVLKAKAVLLEKTLADFGILAKVVQINRGPVITMYELEPSVGTKVAKITSLSDNISLALKSSNIRIVAPLPGKGTIGIEVPNDKSELVLLRDIMDTREYSEESSPLKLALGKDISGNPIILDLAAMPHLLIAGATGSGKTVCINCVISSLLINSSPAELKFLMVDPKRVELMMFEGIPHLVSPIVTSPKKVSAALGWVISEMERRYDIFAEKGVRNIAAYKQKAAEGWEELPYIIIIIDELADLMVVAQQDIEGSIMRLAQLSRAAGIHMILATQRPSVNVITGVIKANFPARISFKVASKVDSRTVLDTNGAEKLLGRGDMLLMEPGRSDVVRGQCGLVEDSEIRNIVKYIRSQAGSQYLEEVVQKQENKMSDSAQEKDDLYYEAMKMVVSTKHASVSMIQRKLKVGYARAARMIDIMEGEGIVGPYNGSKPREILVENVNDLQME